MGLSPIGVIDRLARRFSRREAVLAGIAGALLGSVANPVEPAGAARCHKRGDRCQGTKRCCDDLVCRRSNSGKGKRRCRRARPADRTARPPVSIPDPNAPMPMSDQLGRWSLVFRDEFDGDTVDWSLWNAQYPWGGSRVACCGEKQYYTARSAEGRSGNYWVHDGMLSLIARREAVEAERQSHSFTSGLVQTRNKFNFTAGYFEIRAKLPTHLGAWPAFWLLPVDYSGSRPEWDILEAYGDDPNRVYHCWHLNGGIDGCSRIRMTTADWHVYGFEWNERTATWYVDGVKTAQRAGGFNVPSYLLLNLAIHDRAGDDASANYPAQFDIDYVRAWQAAGRG